MHWKKDFYLVDPYHLLLLNVRHPIIMGFFSRQALMRLKEMRKTNSGFHLADQHLSASTMKKEWLKQYFKTFEDSKIDNCSQTLIHVYAYHILQNDRQKVKEIHSFGLFHLFIWHLIGTLICKKLDIL